MILQDVDLIGMVEPNINSLRLFFRKRKVSDNPERIKFGNKSFTTYPVIVDKQWPVIQIDFKTYISYSITNESYTIWDDYEEFEGKSFRIYRKSRFLDFVRTHTITSDDYPGLFKHYGMVCLDDIVNIVSVYEPIATEVKSEDGFTLCT